MAAQADTAEADHVVVEEEVVDVVEVGMEEEEEEDAAAEVDGEDMTGKKSLPSKSFIVFLGVACAASGFTFRFAQTS